MAVELYMHPGSGILELRLTDSKILDADHIQRIGGELMRAAEDCGWKAFINLSDVQFMSSAMFGKLVRLLKEMRENRGTPLVLCNVHPSIHQVFEWTRLTKCFTVVADAQAARQQFCADEEVAIRTEDRNGVLEISLLDSRTRSTMRIQQIGDEALAAAARANWRFYLNLEAVAYLDEQLIGKLVWIHKELRENRGSGASLVLTGVCPDVREKLQLTRLSTLFRIADTAEQARSLAMPTFRVRRIVLLLPT